MGRVWVAVGMAGPRRWRSRARRMSHRAAVSVVAVLSVALVVGLAGTVRAEEKAESTEERRDDWCWFGRPWPRCRTVVLLGVGGQFGLRESDESALAVGAGLLVNIDRRYGAGGMVAALIEHPFASASLEFRGRRWLYEALAVDVGLGLLLRKDDAPREARALGLTGYVALNVGDQIQLGFGVDVYDLGNGVETLPHFQIRAGNTLTPLFLILLGIAVGSSSGF